MELDEILQRKLNIERLSELASKPASADPYAEMDSLQKSNLIVFLQDMLREKDTQVHELLNKLQEINEKLTESLHNQKDTTEIQKRLEQKIAALQMQLAQVMAENSTLKYDNATLKARLEIKQKQQFDTKSHDRRKSKKKKTEDEGDDFDCNASTPSSAASGGSETAQPETSGNAQSEENKTCYHGPSRLGVTYNKEVSETAITHKSDLTKLPAGAVIIGKPRKYRIRHAVFRIEEHVYEMITYRTPDGELHEQYFPMDGEEGTEYINQVMPGTHVTLDLLNFSIFQRYQLATPAYRESKDLFSELKWKPCRQNLLNWESKAADWLRKLIPALKDSALAEGSDLNVDETWHRYQTHFGQEKIYIWCVVNRKANIVIYYFEDYKDETGKVIKIGSRKAEILKEFLGDAKIRSLQSDSCASYMYLDDDLIDIVHLKCMAHVRAKFYYAELQGSKDATKILNLIDLLYDLEKEYTRQKLDSETIKARRNDEQTESIVQRIRMKLLDLKIQLHQAPETISELLKEAITYLDNAWKQVFSYRQNGDFTIDNMEAERAMKPIANQRKNSYFYCSESGARNAATFNTFIQTCKMAGVPFMSYFKKVMNELKNGRTDYQNLLPATIQL